MEHEKNGNQSFAEQFYSPENPEFKKLYETEPVSNGEKIERVLQLSTVI